MLKWIAAVCLSMVALSCTSFYLQESALCLLLFGYATCPILVSVSPTIRKWRLTTLLWRAGAVASALLAVVWLASVVALVRIPYGKGKAVGVGKGSLIAYSGLSIDGTPLTFDAQWGWSGITAGQFATCTAVWGPRTTAKSQFWAIWPMLVGVALPSVTLFFLIPKRIPPGHCQTCGYDLTGNVSGRCPECGTPIGGTR